VVELSAQEFEHLVADALDRLPDEVLDLMENVVVVVEDDPPEGEDLLGVYEGVPLTERFGDWDGMALPDRIVVYRNPTLGACASVDEVAREVWVTVVHEVAHFHGIEEERIHELGWG